MVDEKVVAMEGQNGLGACAVCTRVCQTTHGDGLPYTVPRFYKTVTDYSTPSSRNCYMQIPAPYVREHIGKGARHTFVLEGVTGSEWEVTFNNIGLSGGWKTFATDYHLEKGDQVMFGLVAPSRFYVNVFDKFGLEKVSTREPLSRKETEPQNRAAEGFHTPLQVVEHGKRCGEQNSNGVGELTLVPQQDVHPNCGVCADDTTPSQNGNHQGSGSKLVHDSPPLAALSPQAGALSLMRTPEFDPARALIEKLRTREPVDCGELELSLMSDSMSDSEDSVQVLLAKAVLAKMRRKKLKKRELSNHGKVVTEDAAKSGGTFRTDVSTLSLNEDKSNNTNRDRRSKILRNLGTGDVTDNLRDDETGARGGIELEKSCEEPSNGLTESQMCSIHHQGAGDSNHEEPQNIGNGTVPQPVHREDEATTGVVNGEDSVSKRAENLSDEPKHVFLAALVKEEPDSRNALGPDMTAETCANCGLSTIPDQEHIGTPPPNLTSEIPETRTPSSDAPSPAARESVRATDVRKQEAAKTSGPDYKTPKSNGRSKGHGKVSEAQKQKALEAANVFSASTKNPSAVVVMRISFVEKTRACFVSVKCAEMLPRIPTEITLVDSEGCLRKANWKPERRYMLGSGWKEFVDVKNLQVNDVCVMEVIEDSSEQCKVLIHVFHAHEMQVLSKKEQKENEREHEEPKKEKEMQQEEEREQRPYVSTPPPNISELSPRARTCHQETGSPGISQLFGVLPFEGLKKRKKSPINGPSSEDGVTGPEVQLSTEEAVATPEPSRKQEESPDSTEERRSSKRERKKVRAFVPLQGSRQTPKEEQSRKLYSVAKLVDRRRGLHGIVFLVELKEPVVASSSSSSNHKKMKSKQDEKGRWWVPDSHFTSDFKSCYVE